jgi:hypothetical protein
LARLVFRPELRMSDPMRTTYREILCVIALFGVGGVLCAPRAGADEVAYLVNVTVRPGYHFANADDALGYGRGICDEIAQGQPYGLLVHDVETDFVTTDDYQASYLITQAANELCPSMIWQLRRSASDYQAPPS